MSGRDGGQAEGAVCPWADDARMTLDPKLVREALAAGASLEVMALWKRQTTVIEELAVWQEDLEARHLEAERVADDLARSGTADLEALTAAGEALRALDAESDRFAAACEQYGRETEKLEAAFIRIRKRPNGP